MRRYRYIQKRAVAFGMAIVIAGSLMSNATGVAAKEIKSENETEEEGFIATDTDADYDFTFSEESLSKERLYQGASKEAFLADGTDGQMPDDEWEALKKMCESMLGQNMDCITFVNKAFGFTKGMASSSKASEWLLANGYYEVVSRTDLTDGTNFTANAEKTIAKIRRGDILVFSNDAGVYSHIGIAGVDDDGSIYIYEGGMYGSGFSNQVCKDTMAYYLSGCKSQNDGYADNIQIFRKKSQAQEGELNPDETDDGEVETYVSVRYNTHVQSYGWQASTTDSTKWKKDGEVSGTSGESKRLEAITISLDTNANLGIAYNTHVQGIGWQGTVTDSTTWKKDGELSGTSGKSKRLEAIQIKLTGEDASKYSVYYRVHAQTYGWLGWAKDGQMAGTSGQSKRLEAIEIVVLPVGETPDGIVGYSYIELGKSASNTALTGAVNYMTHVQTYGDQSYVYDGSVSGTSGESKRLEGISVKLNNDLLGMSGGVRYITHVQTYGWQGDLNDSSTWKSDGQLAGTTGESKRLEAIKLELYGDVAEGYDIYYRVHVQKLGWLGWAKNGEIAGTTGYSYRLEAIQIVLLPKGSAAPGETANSYRVK
jgi:uncharacterized protein YjdB